MAYLASLHFLFYTWRGRTRLPWLWLLPSCSWDGHWQPQCLNPAGAAVPGMWPDPVTCDGAGAAPAPRWNYTDLQWPLPGRLLPAFDFGSFTDRNGIKEGRQPQDTLGKLTWPELLIKHHDSHLPMVPRYLESSSSTEQVKWFPIVFVLQLFCFHPEMQMAFLRTWKCCSLINWIELCILVKWRGLRTVCL